MVFINQKVQKLRKRLSDIHSKKRTKKLLLKRKETKLEKKLELEIAKLELEEMKVEKEIFDNTPYPYIHNPKNLST